METLDILREIDDEELNDIVKRLEEKLPRTIQDLHFVVGAIRHKALAKKQTGVSERLLPVFYVHRDGSKENCTVFGITGAADHTVWCFTFEENLKELTECLEQTTMIRWTEKVLFVTVHKEHTLPILEYTKKKDYSLCWDEDAECYWLAKEKTLKFNFDIPDGTFMKRLNGEDIKICDSLWDHIDSGSESFIRSMVRLNIGYGLCDKTTNELLSFALVNDHLAVGILHTVEHTRGKHYGEFIVKLLSRWIVENLDISPTCYIAAKNLASMNLFKKVGYEKASACNWILVEKK